jgi:hypothetical protein
MSDARNRTSLSMRRRRRLVNSQPSENAAGPVRPADEVGRGLQPSGDSLCPSCRALARIVR